MRQEASDGVEQRLYAGSRRREITGEQQGSLASYFGWILGLLHPMQGRVVLR